MNPDPKKIHRIGRKVQVSMKAKVLKRNNKGTIEDEVEIKIGGKTFFLYERSGDLFLEKLGFTVMDVCFFRQNEKSTTLKIQ